MAIANYDMDLLFDKVGFIRMKDSYLLKDEKSPQDRFVKVCNLFSSNEEHAKRLYNYASNHYISLSSPLLSYDEKNKKSFPISCYLTYIEDNIESILGTLAETNMLSICGGGVSVKFNTRGIEGKSAGVISHIKTYDACVLAYKQQNRRGSFAMYLNIDHPEIFQFIDIRRPTGDYNMRALNIHHCICITDKFMKIIENCSNGNTNDDWELIDIKTKKVSRVVSARKLWERILETRMETGEPYICFIDTCNKMMNPYQKEKGFKINQSNLCTEIIVPTSEQRSSLCCLSSLNLEYYDKWKNFKDIMILDLMEMLDNAILKFIEKTTNTKNNYLNKVLDSAYNEKNIGVGVLGLHAYFQSKNIPFDSEEAKNINIEIFKNIQESTSKANLHLGKLRGSPPDIHGSGKRFTYCTAIAPTATTSIIMGNTSPSIEPYKANIYRQDTISGSNFNKNKFLDKLLKSKGYGENLQKKIWKSIISNKGSVQHIPENLISKDEKNIFKTALEIDQEHIINMAADRQKFIDQAQSISISLSPDVSVSKIHNIHLNAWKKGLKTLYYCRSEKIYLADNLTENIKFSSCESCQA